jgi:hypothetical protein
MFIGELGYKACSLYIEMLSIAECHPVWRPYFTRYFSLSLTTLSRLFLSCFPFPVNSEFLLNCLPVNCSIDLTVQPLRRPQYNKRLTPAGAWCWPLTSSYSVKNKWSYTAAPLMCLHGVNRCVSLPYCKVWCIESQVFRYFRLGSARFTMSVNVIQV